MYFTVLEFGFFFHCYRVFIRNYFSSAFWRILNIKAKKGRLFVWIRVIFFSFIFLKTLKISVLFLFFTGVIPQKIKVTFSKFCSTNYRRTSKYKLRGKKRKLVFLNCKLKKLLKNCINILQTRWKTKKITLQIRKRNR